MRARNPTRQLALATLAFTASFAAWSLISPFAKTFKADLGLSYTQALLLTAREYVFVKTQSRKPFVAEPAEVVGLWRGV